MGAWDRPNVSGYKPYLQITATDSYNHDIGRITIKNSAGEIVLMYEYSDYLMIKGNGFIENYADPGTETSRRCEVISLGIVF